MKKLLLLAAALCLAAQAMAQSIVLTPAVVQLSGETGQSVTHQMTLTNETDSAQEFEMQAQDVVVVDGQRRFLEAGRLSDSIAATAVFPQKRLVVAPHSSGTTQVTFTLPDQMRHRAVIALMRGRTPLKSGSKQTFFSLGTLFTFDINGQHSVKATALESSAPTTTTNAQLHTTLTNDGTEPVVPGGMAVLLDAQGRMIGKAPFARKRLLPGERTTVSAEYPGELAPGSYRAVATFDVATGQSLTLTSTLEVQ